MRESFAAPLTLLALCYLLSSLGCRTSPQSQSQIAYFPAPPAEPRVVHLKSFNSIDELMPHHGTWVDAFRDAIPADFVRTPAGLAYRNNHLYICDTTINAVHDWNLATGQTRLIGVGKNGDLRKPVAVAVDAQGQIYVADTVRGCVVVLDAGGRELRTLKPPNISDYRPVAVDTMSTNVVVRSDMGESGNAVGGCRPVIECGLLVADQSHHRIDFFTCNGQCQEFTGGIGSEPDHFYFPSGVAIDDDLRIFVSDSFNSRVQVIKLFEQTRSFGKPGDRYGDMGKPRHVAASPDGVFIADPEFMAVHLYNHDGQLLMMIGGPGDKPGRTALPVSVAVAPSIEESFPRKRVVDRYDGFGSYTVNFHSGDDKEPNSTPQPFNSLIPDSLKGLIPADFEAHSLLFVSNTIGEKKLNLFAIGERKK